MQKMKSVFEQFVGLIPENKKVIVNDIRDVSKEGQDKIMNLLLPELTKTVNRMQENNETQTIIYIEKNGKSYSVPVYFNITKSRAKAELILQKDGVYFVIIVSFGI